MASNGFDRVTIGAGCMGKRWSQRRAWIVMILASLFGWAVIAAIVLIPFLDRNVPVAENPAGQGPSDMKPASGPSETDK